ncbi:MAG TPA: hypothetical protein VGE42_00890 [Candidatus Dormibacteraeota bacterium]
MPESPAPRVQPITSLVLLAAVIDGQVTDRGRAAVPAMCVAWKLRSGVLWHDGSRFGAHDACATAEPPEVGGCGS